MLEQFLHNADCRGVSTTTTKYKIKLFVTNLYKRLLTFATKISILEAVNFWHKELHLRFLGILDIPQDWNQSLKKIENVSTVIEMVIRLQFEKCLTLGYHKVMELFLVIHQFYKSKALLILAHLKFHFENFITKNLLTKQKQSLYEF